jgi:phosphoribosylformimino-5-aminoimidazole carboxamide ribotide isomerase
MIVYPAIDIRAGRCVRLVEGDFSRETVFDANPADAARRWQSLGAEWLHVVDLDGALEGKSANSEAISAIRAAIDVPIQLGGGLRSIETIEAAFSLGIDRAIIGTAALRDPALVKEAASRWPNYIAVGLDARDGKLAVQGWTDSTDQSPLDVAIDFERVGIRHFIFTDISRDGTLVGPNLEAFDALNKVVRSDVIASGGIGKLADVVAIRELGAAGVIIGRAIYDGRVDLAEAIEAAGATEALV